MMSSASAAEPRRRLRSLPLVVLVGATFALGGCDSCNRLVDHFQKKGLKQAQNPVTHTTDDDRAALVAGPAASADAPVEATPAMAITCTGAVRPISPTIFGIAFADADPALNATAYRWGGNTATRYNFRLSAWNTGSDWYFQNVAIDSHEVFLKKVENRLGVAAITIPIMGWVAKDTTSASFPVSQVGPQEKTDPDHSDFGNGKKPDGTEIVADPKRTSVPITPADVTEWIKAMKAADEARGKKLIYEYILDNETGLWDSTHRDVHPEPMTYDELLAKTIAFGTAIRQADPNAIIAGPSSWGWPEYFFSAKDTKEGYSKKPDRAAHGDVPLLAWYLRELKKYREKTGIRIVDVLDVHFYPQGENVQELDGPDNAGGGSTDDETNELRFRSTRALWDCTYVDESWISEPQCLIPRMHEIIAQNDPTVKFQIGEWNFGGERHPAGGVALAEALGRFAEFGVDSAFYWTFPKKGSPAYWAFRAFRNYDDLGGHFYETLLPSKAPTGTSLYASRDATGKKLVAIALNFSAHDTKQATIQLAGCGAATKVKAYEADATAKGLQPLDVTVNGAAISAQLRPYSVTVIEVTSP